MDGAVADGARTDELNPDGTPTPVDCAPCWVPASGGAASGLSPLMATKRAIPNAMTSSAQKTSARIR